MYLGDGGCKDYDLVQLTHSLHELVHARSLDDIYIVVVTLNLHWYCEVCLVKYLGDMVSYLPAKL